METTVNTKLDFLSGGGKMGELIRAKDWSKNPLGTPDTWPQSLRTTVSLCIASNFPIAIAWGAQRVQIYNDGYLPITGDMHPTSMGQDFKECWLSAWPVIGEAFEEASLGETRFLENQQIFLDRYGYKEETFFTFSFSPILDETGGVGGLFHPIIEMTQQILAERRLTILRVVANCTLNAKTVKEASALIIDCLKDFELDLPFALLYGMPADGKKAQLQGSFGVEIHSPLAPAIINIEQSLKCWPIAEAIKTGKGLLVEEVAEIFGIVHCGPYPETPTQALVFPITIPSAAHTNYFLVVGVSSRRRLDEKYLSFYELLNASVTNALTKAIAYEEERKKAEALAEIDKAKTVFFSNISHEFRTPLTLMLSPLEELLNQQNSHFSESEKNNIETSHRNAMRLLKLVNTLLDFSSIEAGRQQAVFSLVDIVPLTKNLAANFRSVIEKAGLQLIVQADSFIQPVYVDQQMWEKIIFNLLSNAFKYTLKGKITIELTAEIDYAVLKIIDTGIGIPEDELPKMFERFHRVQHVSGRTFEGTGIGLSLIKELVHMHKGVIEVESKVNVGSTFTVKIPFGKEHIKTSQISQSENMSDQISSNMYVDEIEGILKAEKNLTSKLSNEKIGSDVPIILVVDDNTDMREHIRSVLSTNFNVITANNGLDALHKLKETIPALVLSDIMMPVMDGIGLLREIKNNQATSSIPVILLTARAGEESKIEGLETGADDYLVKPFSAKELLARIQAQIKIVKLRQSLEGNVRNLFMEAPAVICVLRGPQHVHELTNKMYLKLIGNRDVLGKSIREALPELEGQGIFELLDTVYTTGVPFIGNETPRQLDKGNGKLEEVYFNFVYQPAHNSDGEINGILVHGVDVTEQILARKKIKESEKRFSNLLMESPFAFAILKGKDMVVSLANDAIKSVWGKGSDIEGKSLLFLMPEIKEQGFAALLEEVYTTGKPFYGHEELVKLQRNGIWEDVYFNFIYQPYKETDETISGVTIIANEVTTQAIANKKIAVSEQRFKNLIHNASVAIVVLTGPEMKIEIVNKSWGNLIEKTPDELINQPVSNFMREIEAYYSPLLNKVYLTGEPLILYDSPYLVKKDDKIIEGFLHIFYEPYRNENGNILGVMIICQDVTETVLARKKIEESEAKYKSLIAASPIGIGLLMGRDLILESANQQYIDLIGKGSGIEGKKFTAIMPELVGQPYLKILNDIFTTGKSYQSLAYPVSVIRNGILQHEFYDINYTPLFDGEGNVYAILNIAKDVTVQTLSNKEIIASEEKFRNVLLQSPGLFVILKGPEMLIDFVNESVLHSWGRTKDIVGKTILEALPEIKDQAFPRLLAEVYKTGKNYFGKEEKAVIIKDGEPEDMYYNYVYQPIFQEDKIISGITIMAIDITEQVIARKKVEESEKLLEQKVIQRTIQLNEKNIELQKMNKELEAFTYISSHDLQEPLRKIQTFAGRIISHEKEHLSETAKDYFEKMNNAANRMRILIQDLLAFSRLSTSERKFEHTDLNTIIEDVKEELAGKNATIISEEICEVNIIPFQFRQLMYNLVSNALKFTKPDVVPCIIIKSSTGKGSKMNNKKLLPDKEYCYITISDNGIGFNNEYSEKIFEVFQKLHSKDEYAGTGIGLAIVKKIIDNHNGIITAEGELGKGATFHIYIPN